VSNVSKFQTVKFSKNFNVKISMKFSRRKNFMKLYLWATKREGVGLSVRAISFQDFQPMWSWSTNVTDSHRLTDGQTDGRSTCNLNTVLWSSASRGKNLDHITSMSLGRRRPNDFLAGGGRNLKLRHCCICVSLSLFTVAYSICWNQISIIAYLPSANSGWHSSSKKVPNSFFLK